MKLIDDVPLLLVFVVVIGLALLFVEGGFRLGMRLRSAGAHEPEAQIGAMVTTTLGLLAFLLAFTFGIAASRFDDRRTAVLTEANAIGTTYLRAEFLDDAAKERVKKLLREYVALRVSSTPVDEIVLKSQELQTSLWSEASTAGRAHPNLPVIALFISSLNDVIDAHARRVTVGLYTRVPPVVWFCLLTLSALSMTGLGYSCGLAGNRSWTATLILITSFGLVMALVADLDRPSQGLIKTSQQPMIDLNKQLGAP